MKSNNFIDQIYNSKVIRAFLLIVIYPILFGLLSAITNFYLLKNIALAFGKVINSLELTVYTTYRCVPISVVAGFGLAIVQSLRFREKIRISLFLLAFKTVGLAWIIMVAVQYFLLPVD